ncbi:hypothetical protein PLEOSDRAFT_1112748 [Pleurotus ostreatus PC15]|uniref:Uncharacterized protein n=1 Tax=Pleurotus ostreatus (strain PC15) TaxID=1137138 RepID=A0A067NW89_PLEO1|nr:hypothetical protein PLEOSDRAFT_1112748 [Pleurotus ostreatus PC15]
MEQYRPASRASDDSGSAASLAGHAQQPAGFNQTAGYARTTPAGVPVGAGGVPATGAYRGTSDVPHDAQDGPQPAPPHVPFYKKRWFIISQLIIIPLGIALLFILLFPVIKAIAQLVVNRSTLDIQVAQITEPLNNTFQLALQGNVAHTGIINARIEFKNPVRVTWLDGDNEVPIGVMNLSPLSTMNKRATINDTTVFNITDEAAFGRFAGQMITAQNFTWRLESENLHVQALKFPLSKGIKFKKDVTLNGFNSFSGNVALKDFKLPSDNPQGGIDFVAITTLNNPSPFSLNLGTVLFDLSYKDVFLGTGTGTDTVIAPGPVDVTLKGRLVPHTSEAELAVMSDLFTRYLNGESSLVFATGRSTLQGDNSSISWLSDGLKSLRLEVPFKSSIPIDPIKTISIGDFSLAFTEADPWSPTALSRTVEASLQLPFGFGLSIGEIQNDFNITKNGAAVAGLSTPLGASTSSISVLSPDDTSGSINITIDNAKLNSPDPMHPAFSAFNAELTSADMAEFRLVGNSRAIANMSIGTITLDPIKVNVSTHLQGLQGLKGLVSIDSVDVLGGTTEGITLGINVNISNPSNLNLATGDLNLQLFRDGVPLGTNLLPNLTLTMGDNFVKASSNFKANDSPEGLQTLNDFVGKKDVNLHIAGFDQSTKVVSLLEAFKSLGVDVVLPGLKTNLLDTAELRVLPTTGRANNISHVRVNLDNPFSTALKITKITSAVTVQGINLGNIETDTDFSSDPKSKTTSPDLDFNLNFDPNSLFTVTRLLAVDAGLDTTPLDGIVDVGGYTYLFTTGNPPRKQQRANIFTGFNLPEFVQTAFKELKSDVELTTDVTMGDYKTTLKYTQPGVPTKTDESLNLILPVLAQPIVQKVVSESGISIDDVLIIDPQQNSFKTRLRGGINNAGPFDAKISFNQGLTVVWAGKPIGNMKLTDVDVVGDVGAVLDVETTFDVTDVDHITEFTKVLLTEESFEWEISGDNLTVSAMGIQVDGISLSSKKVTLKGFNGLKGGVKIKSFDLPANDPAGGIHLTIEADATNPSQVGVQLSSLGFNTFVGNTMIAPVASKEVTLAPGSTSPLSLVGRLVPQASQEGLDIISQVFTNFLHGKDSNVVVHGASAGPSEVTWLNEGIKTLQVDTILPNRGPLDVIQSITLNELKLLFTQDTAYNPATSSSSTSAAFTLPFGFPLDITSLQQKIGISFNGQSFATLDLPKAPTKTDVKMRVIALTFSDVPFAVDGNRHSVFDDFVAATTVGKSVTMHLSGSSNAEANTAVGLLSLPDIAFSVDSSIDGLQGLNTRPVTVSGLDVNHGFPDFLLIKVDSALFNPSNLTVGTGDVSFALQFQDQTVGSADINGLVIQPGNASYPIDVHYAPQGAAQQAGRTLLQNFLQGVDSDTAISGNTGSTTIGSLKSALSQIRLSPVTIPAIHQTLVQSTSLSFPIDIVETGIASATFTLANPFTASINLLRVGTVVTFHGLTLGKIDNVDISSSPVHADGHSTATSPSLPFTFNLEPSNIIRLLTISSQEQDVSLGPLGQMFQFLIENPEFKPPVKTAVDTQAPTCVSGHQFDAAGAILKSLSGLKVNLAVDTHTKLDDFATDLSFNQANVPAITDRSVLFTIGAVAGPIAQHLVDGSKLQFSEANITNVSNDGFDLSLQGSLTDAGPLDALISFTEPVTVTWNGNNIAQITLPPICAAADSGVPNYQTNGRLKITDVSQFTAFATALLHDESFEWTISTDKLRVQALGTIFDNVSLSKKVLFKAFNGLNGVTISNFQLPHDDHAGGISIQTDSLIPSPAQLGIQLGTVGFESFFEGTHVGPLSGSGLFLTAGSITPLPLTGRIVPQSDSDLQTIGKLFSGFLAGQNQTLVAKGDFIQPGASSVGWLSEAFKTLELTVTLPGQISEVITAITLDDFAVTMKTPDQAFAPLASSQGTVAQYKNPFGFSLQVIESKQTLILSSSGVDIAQLDIPNAPANGGVSTGNPVDLPIAFKDVPMKSLNNQGFQALFAHVTLQETAALDLKGTADVTAHTAIGNVPISGIPFKVPSSLKGINSFGGTASLSNVSVTGSGGNGGSEFIVSPLINTLHNPSNVTLSTVDISLPVMFNGVKIGRAAIDPFNLVPGDNDIPAEFHYQPDDANNTVAQGFLTQFIQTDNRLPLVIQGDSASTPFASLQPALSGLRLSSQLAGTNNPTIITHVQVLITLDSLVTNLVSVNFDVFNPFNTDLVIEFVQSDSGVNGQIFAHFEQPFDNFVIPPGQTVNSGTFGNVLLTQGAIAALDIIPLGILDIGAANTVRIGRGGYQVPWLQLNQKAVPTKYDLQLGFSAMKQKAESVNATSGSEALSSTSASASTAAVESSAAAPESTKGEAEALPTTKTPDAEPSISQPEAKPEQDAPQAKPTPTPSASEESLNDSKDPSAAPTIPETTPRDAPSRTSS